MVEEIKKMLDDMPTSDLHAVSDYIFKLYDAREPAVTLMQGQIVEFENAQVFPSVIEFGFSEKEQVNCRRPQIIQYLRQFKSLRMTYVEASKIKIHDECVDVAAVFEKLEELAMKVNGPLKEKGAF